MSKVEDMKIISNLEIAKDIYELVVQGENVELMKEPGQFVNLKIDSMSHLILRRPISICEIDMLNKQFKMIYRVEGEGTKLLSRKTYGDTLNILGPLGRGYPEFAIENHQTALIIGGGIGIPPLYELTKRLHNRNISVISVLGFSSISDVFYEEEFKKYSEVYISTIDGSYGFLGNVIDLIKTKKLQFDVIYSCGPKAMLKAIQTEYKDHKTGYISVEERMACGIGACYACVCDTNKNSSVRVCKEGPVFKLDEVIL